MTGSERYLLYHLYLSGRAGLSNELMSLELGVVLAHLSGRTLVLEGNASPSANLVDYDGALPPGPPSLVTDLVELPVPWCDASEVDLARHEAVEWIDAPLHASVFYYPPERDVRGFDARSFARGREHFFTVDEATRSAPLLALSGGPPVGPHRFRTHNFGFYSYLLYLDEDTRRRVHRLLRAMAPRAPFAELAARIASGLGAFNAVHIRRGDFKQTFGVTTAQRQPREVIDALAPHFDRCDPLVILTDDDTDPFFDEIVAAYPEAVFLDRIVLGEYRDAFAALPRRDGIALAFVAQQVAAASRDFVGSLNSTFSALIQRARGNRGQAEPFKFLWNELADEGVELERGRHAASTCVPLEDGVMVEEFLGPYSWNRVNPRLDPAWMREWPEAFLDPA